jgi:FMN phosphatase YigB (HAD superfamily)
MVGDTPEADILGANQMGIYSILVTRRVNGPAAHQAQIQPDCAVKTLAEIPALLNSVHEL